MSLTTAGHKGEPRALLPSADALACICFLPAGGAQETLPEDEGPFTWAFHVQGTEIVSPPHAR